MTLRDVSLENALLLLMQVTGDQASGGRLGAFVGALGAEQMSSVELCVGHSQPPSARVSVELRRGRVRGGAQ